MNKNIVVNEVKNLVERIKCQQFAPAKDQERFKEQVGAFLNSGHVADQEIFSSINEAVILIVRDLVHLNGEKDKNHFADIVELLLIQSSNLAKTLRDE